jgi:hypothetical protein
VPRAGQTASGGQDALDERRAIVCALGANGLDFSAGVDEQDFSVLDALNLDLLLVARGGRESGDVLELKLLGGHDWYREGEASSLGGLRRRSKAE